VGLPREAQLDFGDNQWAMLLSERARTIVKPTPSDSRLIQEAEPVLPKQ